VGRSNFKCRDLADAVILAALVLTPAPARGQACCAGAAAVTPGRLLLHEDALVGLETRAAVGIGSYESDGTFVNVPSDSTELELEQDVFGAVRVTDRGQAALLLPMVETYRGAAGRTELGGGQGDLNLSGRYDFTLSGQYRYVPGVAVLLGITAPTGKPVDRSEKPLATDATGVGAWQGTAGLALEQTFGDWFVGVTAFAADRLPRTVQGLDGKLATRFTLLAVGAWSFSSDGVLAMSLSYQAEGNATLGGQVQPDSGQRAWTIGLSGGWSFSDVWRAHVATSLNPPASGFGANVPALASVSLGVVRSWL
jgi:hypothetical protein